MSKCKHDKISFRYMRSSCESCKMTEQEIEQQDTITQLKASQSDCKRVEGERDTLRDAARWMPVAESLPSESGFVIVAAKHRSHLPALVCLNPFNVETGLFSEHTVVTHWMPLPAPPIGDEK